MIVLLSIILLIWLYCFQKQPEIEIIPIAAGISEDFIDIDNVEEIVLSGYEIEDIDSP